MIEPVALRERARELVLGQRALCEQHLLDRHPGPARGLYGRGNGVRVHEPELDDQV